MTQRRGLYRVATNWPNARAYTLQYILDELERARAKHQNPGHHVRLIESYTAELKEALANNFAGNGVQFSHCFALACTVAAMAIRCAEEGSVPYKIAPQASAKAVPSIPGPLFEGT